MTIQRYHGVEQACVFKSDTGSLVYYIDHQRDKEAAVAEKDKDARIQKKDHLIAIGKKDMRISELLEALEFYADRDNWRLVLKGAPFHSQAVDQSRVDGDYGGIARKALGGDSENQS